MFFLQCLSKSSFNPVSDMGQKKPKKKPTKPAGQSRSLAENETEEVVPHTKLYVGNLAGMEMTDAKFRQLFEEFGEIVSLELVCTNNHTFGFVEFASVPEATCAIEKKHGESGMVVKYAKNASGQAAIPVNKTKQTDAKIDDSEKEEETQDEEEADTNGADADESEVSPAVLVHPNPRAAAAQAYPNPVENLQALVQKTTKATSTRDNIIYTIEETDFDFVATLKLVVPAGTRTSVGQPKENKQAAKKSAAQVALRDPEVHKLLPPPAPSKVENEKAAKARVSKEDNRSEETVDPSDSSSHTASEVSEAEEEVNKGPFLSAKKQRQLKEAELRAQRAAKRKAAKAAKAAQAKESDDEEEEEEDVEDSDVEDTEESEESDSDDSEEDDEIDSTTDDEADENAAIDSVAFRKAAIKAALAAKRRGKSSGKQTVSSKDKASDKPKQQVVEKAKKDDMYGKVEDTRKQANYGQTKFIKP